MKVLVTGASGMLGASLCRRLRERGVEVRAFTRQPLRHPLLEGLGIEEAAGHLLDVEALRRALEGCDGAYHVAGLVSYRECDRAELYRVNVQGTETVLRAAVAAGVRRMVITSSTAAVGIPRPGEAPLNEDASFRREFQGVPYMATKRAAEELALCFPGVEVVVVNPSTIYGTGDVKMNTGVVFQRIAAGKLRFVPPGGTGVVSVGDCVEGHLLAMTHGQPGRRYILSRSNHTYLEVFGSIARCLGVMPPQRVVPALVGSVAYAVAALVDRLPGERSLSRHVVKIGFSKRYFDASRARSELGWQPKQDLEEMCAEAADFYRGQRLL